MLKVSMKICLLTTIFILTGFILLYEPLSITLLRYLGIIFIVSFFFLPGVVVFNALLSGISSLKIHPGSGWMLLLVSIILTTHLFISLIVSILDIHPGSAELVWLILNTSTMMALLIRIRTIHRLFKSFYYEKGATYSIN